MKETGDSEDKIRLIEEQFDTELRFMKTSFSEELKLAQLATPYHTHFEDWGSSMQFLQKNADEAKAFINKYKKQNNN